ncbi:acyltransferase [Nocardia ninae]|uniref:Phthiocerol/phthiodiolone dimycocerosyl transferase n=1 Tax=Nocardia ninae NBRC 108245 TaxID=1210091 RepID=A0A511MU77_9NOCA|nr:acyltransferase [Nocardia ninae]GEM44120.1 acyltransferase [Nocardia ninae NBRC 108245]
MTTATVIRPLAPSEEIFAGSEVLVGYSMRLSGRLNLTALSAAYEAVVHAYPAFGAHLEANGRGHVIVESPRSAPEFTVVDGNPELLLSGARLDQRTALAALCVVRDGDSTGVTLVTHHSIADACHSLAVLAELWSCYTEVSHGRAPMLEPHRFPDAVEDLLLARCVEKMSGLPVSARTLMVAEAPRVLAPVAADDSYLLPLTARCRLTKQETTALADLAHREGTTINGLASAAILLTEAELRELPLTELSYTYSVDLRNRVTPAIGYTEGTNVLGFADFVPTVGAGTTLVELGRAISDGLRSGLATGVVQQTPLHIPDIASGPPPRAPGIVLATNWGRIDRPQLPDGLRIDDFRTVMIAKPDKAGHRLQQPSGTIIISTFDDQLSIEIHHPVETTAQQKRRVRLLAAHLDAVSEVGAA